MNKLENTLENKARFFALYWGQEVHYYRLRKLTPFKKHEVNGSTYGYLVLTPLSQISEEDLKAISFNFPDGTEGIEFDFQPNNYKFHWKAKKGINVKEGYLTLKDFDYLRSKGYALPFHNLSVQDLIDYKWVRLKDLGQ